MQSANYGRIVNIASIAGKEGNPNASAYSASKAGLIGLTKSLGKELATTNICVNVICPAVIDTEMLKDVADTHIAYMLSKIPMGRMGVLTKLPIWSNFSARKDAHIAQALYMICQADVLPIRHSAVSWLDTRQRTVQIVDYIICMLKPHRQAQGAVSKTGLLTLF